MCHGAAVPWDCGCSGTDAAPGPSPPALGLTEPHQSGVPMGRTRRDVALAAGLWKQLEAGDATGRVAGSRGTQWCLLISTGCVPGRGAAPQPSPPQRPSGVRQPPRRSAAPGAVPLPGGRGSRTQAPFSPAAEPPVCKQPGPALNEPFFPGAPPGRAQAALPLPPRPWVPFARGSIAGASAGPREARPVPRLGLALLIAAAAL